MFIDGLGSGGAQKQFVRLARGLRRQGHRITVAVYNDQDHFAGEIIAAGIEIVRFAKPHRWSPQPILGLARLYRRLRADVVIAFLRSPATMAELARLANPGMRVIVAERSTYPEGFLSPWFRISQHLHRWAQFITVNSAHQRERVKATFPHLAGRVLAIMNAITLPRERAEIRASITHFPRLLVISSLMDYKNSVLLAKAVAVLRDEFGIRVQISWLGETFAHLDDYGAYRDTCAVIARLGLEDQWSWMGVRADVKGALAKHDALIHPSRIEGMSNAICEAMAMGLPVIAGPISDHTELLEKSDAGRLFQIFDPHDIARTIAEFVALDGDARAAMGQAGRVMIEQAFGEEQLIAKYERVIEAAITGGCLPSEKNDELSEPQSCAA